MKQAGGDADSASSAPPCCFVNGASRLSSTECRAERKQIHGNNSCRRSRFTDCRRSYLENGQGQEKWKLCMQLRRRLRQVQRLSLISGNIIKTPAGLHPVGVFKWVKGRASLQGQGAESIAGFGQRPIRQSQPCKAMAAANRRKGQKKQTKSAKSPCIRHENDV